MSPTPNRPRIKPSKRLGQNFLRDDNTARKIASLVGAPPNGNVIEIGGGTGALTRFLAPKFGNLKVVEVDVRAVQILSEQFPSVEVIQSDVLNLAWESFPSPLHVIGNLPYYITSEILFSLFDAAPVIKQAVLTMQLEVAHRIVAKPRTKAYGILGVAAQLHSVPTISMRLSPNVFFPKPKVESAVVVFDFFADAHHDDVLRARSLSRQAFNQRRKKLRNSLRAKLTSSGKTLPTEVASKRAEELSPAEFVELSRYLDS